MNGYATWLADTLREAGLPVVEWTGWKHRGAYAFRNLSAVVWHHDASPPGDSPGVPAYMIREMDAGRPGAQLWVNRQGVWHVLAAGVAYHAGRVRPGMPRNSNSLGIETDHTTGERWPQPLLDSLRAGSAAILRRLGQDENGLHMHKTICDPPGRKTDPDWLDLAAERRRIHLLLHPPPPAPAPLLEEDDVARLIKAPDKGATFGTDGTQRWHVPSPPVLKELIAIGLYGDGRTHVVSQETIDALPLVERAQ
jgi:hypothetical protein